MSEPSRDRAIIDRLQVRYHTGGSADLARARLERIAQGTLRDACAAAISQVMDTLGEANSEAVIRIRSLQADFLWAVDDASDTAADVVLAERWASVIGEGLGRTITDGSPARRRPLRQRGRLPGRLSRRPGRRLRLWPLVLR
jgi:hypothetical protein